MNGKACPNCGFVPKRLNRNQAAKASWTCGRRAKAKARAFLMVKLRREGLWATDDKWSEAMRKFNAKWDRDHR